MRGHALFTPDPTDSSTAEVRPWFQQNWKWIVTLVFACLTISRFTVHFGYIDEDKKQAAKLINQFHDRINAGQFDQIYDDAHATLRNSLTRQEWLIYMQETRDQFGRFKKVSSSQLNVVMTAPVQIRAACNSTFEEGEAAELFNLVREDDNVELLAYGICPSKDFRAAQQAAQQFYGRMANGQYDAIYDDASADLKNAATRDSLISFLTQVNEQLGACRAASLVGDDYSRKGGRFVGLVYERKCTHGDVNERFAWRIADGKASLRGYHPAGSALTHGLME